jgi:hypothetical protein
VGVAVATSRKQSRCRTGPVRKKRRGGQNLLGITYVAEDFDIPLRPEIRKYFE